MKTTYEVRGNDVWGYAVYVTTPGVLGGSEKVVDCRSKEWAEKIATALTAQEAN